MRFLVVQQPKEDVPGKYKAEEMISRVLAHMEYFKDLKGKGDVVFDGAFAGQRGGFGVFEVDTLEELSEIINYAPATPYMDTEIFPLVDMDSRIEQLKEQMERHSEKAAAV